MKLLKNFIYISVVFLLVYSCGSSSIKKKTIAKEKPVRIANDSLEYEIIIIDPGFNMFLASVAQPVGFYNQSYMEARNNAWVISWNQRNLNPQRFDANIYENQIDYQPNIDYGYDVNYKLFNYFLFAQKKYKMNLGGGFRTKRLN